MKQTDLINRAYEITGEYRPSDNCSSGGVGAALVTKNDNVYTGVCIDTACSLGFCAEHSAIAEMLKHKESEIEMIVAVNRKKEIAAPCGRCRELIFQVNNGNLNTKVILSEKETISLEELLPHRWLETWA